ncbi:hypothetical protein BV22DRAFT_158784 [Leucogyrophana mollusca]|uniref:Uncharacterized protein n=1 Tax=Leucogyrophana mollusca TaxID=85980 RepID=A0ACB8BV03_9AGAM|nr:hypothetical protein BV22DRAFT_158784 [Leucogyrophana mollusca]
MSNHPFGRRGFQHKTPGRLACQDPSTSTLRRAHQRMESTRAQTPKPIRISYNESAGGRIPGDKCTDTKSASVPSPDQRASRTHYPPNGTSIKWVSNAQPGGGLRTQKPSQNEKEKKFKKDEGSNEYEVSLPLLKAGWQETTEKHTPNPHLPALEPHEREERGWFGGADFIFRDIL